MAFKALFVGINKHQDAGVLELTGAVRDAQALHSLFQDTFTDIDARLLVDSEATLDAIRSNLDRTLAAATPDDVVVISFAGHGTEAHQIVAYDTDRDVIGATTLPMEELAAKFRSSSARAILCISTAALAAPHPRACLRAFPCPGPNGTSPPSRVRAGFCWRQPRLPSPHGKSRAQAMAYSPARQSRC
jgi:hypothetical protein